GGEKATGPVAERSGDAEALAKDKQKAELKPGAPALTASALVSAGDAICGRSQEAFKAATARFPEGENEPDPEYSAELNKISTRAVAEFNDLTPPPNLSRAFKAYVKAQERVHLYDEQALKAAAKDHLASYLKAREKRDDGVEERHQLAQAVGFEVCSANTG
ncbi:MAG TPA: hypothetical protein VII45_05695, partial [Solirubrobacterales bacterium]